MNGRVRSVGGLQPAAGGSGPQGWGCPDDDPFGGRLLRQLYRSPSNKVRLPLASILRAFRAILRIVAACLLSAFARLRGYLQIWVTRCVFRRPSVNEPIQELLSSQTSWSSEEELVQNAAKVVADYVGATGFEVIQGDGSALPDLATNVQRAEAGSWMEAVAPLQLSRGEPKVIALGARTGGRRYLSEDFRELSRLAAVIVAKWSGFVPTPLSGSHRKRNSARCGHRSTPMFCLMH